MADMVMPKDGIEDPAESREMVGISACYGMLTV